MAPVFEIHLENWNHALHIEGRGHKSDINWLYGRLMYYGIMPITYVLRDWIDENRQDYEDLCGAGYIIKSHGVHHYYDEKADRSPYFNQEGIPFPPSGGFFFRIAPLWYLKWAIKTSNVFWIHPHDLDEQHPKLKNPLLNFKRTVGLSSAKAKLEKLLQEVKFE